MAVYFLRPVGLLGPIKIGFSQSPAGRLRAFQAWSPIPLEIVAIMPGGMEVERRLHAQFAHLHSHGEWFSGEPEVWATIDQIAAGTFDVEALPPPKLIRTPIKWTAEAKADIGAAQRINWMRKWGYPIPAAVSEATGGRYRCTPTELTAKRLTVSTFVAEHYVAARSLRGQAGAA